ncbi:hypothetical protein J1N35_025240 [Gossypium stocksii]|uniref:Secreted protein n=1 Tax=Gossypium stocksii TaxID=47602 RepID=A0A9D3V5X8_9ROSI|nr:hypothetical protein J1N35_025240 [Gossypium stocksii]
MIKFVLTLLPPILTFSANSRPVEHASAEHVVLSALETGTLSELRTRWTCVWVVYGAHGTSYEFFGYIRSGTATFPRSLHAEPVPFSHELVLQAVFVILPYELVRESCELGLVSWV